MNRMREVKKSAANIFALLRDCQQAGRAKFIYSARASFL
jgi:hypothetical protein